MLKEKELTQVPNVEQKDNLLHTATRTRGVVLTSTSAGGAVDYGIIVEGREGNTTSGCLLSKELRIRACNIPSHWNRTSKDRFNQMLLTAIIKKKRKSKNQNQLLITAFSCQSMSTQFLSHPLRMKYKVTIIWSLVYMLTCKSHGYNWHLIRYQVKFKKWKLYDLSTTNKFNIQLQLNL